MSPASPRLSVKNNRLSLKLNLLIKNFKPIPIYLASSQPVKNIDTVSTQTDQDEANLSSLNKISGPEREVSQMDHNQDILLSQLKLQRKDYFALQEDMSMINKKWADMFIFANNLYHVLL